MSGCLWRCKVAILLEKKVFLQKLTEASKNQGTFWIFEVFTKGMNDRVKNSFSKIWGWTSFQTPLATLDFEGGWVFWLLRLRMAGISIFVISQPYQSDFDCVKNKFGLVQSK